MTRPLGAPLDDVLAAVLVQVLPGDVPCLAAPMPDDITAAGYLCRVKDAVVADLAMLSACAEAAESGRSISQHKLAPGYSGFVVVDPALSRVGTRSSIARSVTRCVEEKGDRLY